MKDIVEDLRAQATADAAAGTLYSHVVLLRAADELERLRAELSKYQLAPEAQNFLRNHSEWLADSWGRSPEGREYKRQFDHAVESILTRGKFTPEAPSHP